ncbi:MAG TPA: type III pantothenate kinase, partial [Synergistales bacterium]|nr:type III pantothenate kinase [Synergistales bacterium]
MLDVGNTNTVIGIYDEERLLKHWRLMSVIRTA